MNRIKIKKLYNIIFILWFISLALWLILLIYETVQLVK
jgi:hypothetical protein